MQYNHRLHNVAVLLVGLRLLTTPHGVAGQAFQAQNCKVSSWSAWSDCTEPVCGGGTTFRTREILKKAKYGGKKCPSNLHEEEACNQTKCFSFLLMGNTGNEKVQVLADGEVGNVITLPAFGTWKPFKVKKDPHVQVLVKNTKWDQDGNLEDSEDKVFFSWFENLYYGDELNVKGTGPEYVGLVGDSTFGKVDCDADVEHLACKRARNGRLLAKGVYDFTFPLNLPTSSPTASPTPAPTPFTVPSVNAISWQLITSEMNWDESTGVMSTSNGRRRREGATSEDLSGPSVVFFKMQATSDDGASVGFSEYMDEYYHGDDGRRDFDVDWESDRGNSVCQISRPSKNFSIGQKALVMLEYGSYVRGSSADGSDVRGTYGQEYFESTDVLAVGINAEGLVRWYRNGVHFRTCEVTLEFPVYVDTTFTDADEVQFLGMLEGDAALEFMDEPILIHAEQAEAEPASSSGR